MLSSVRGDEQQHDQNRETKGSLIRNRTRTGYCIFFYVAENKGSAVFYSQHRYCTRTATVPQADWGRRTRAYGHRYNDTNKAKGKD